MFFTSYIMIIIIESIHNYAIDITRSVSRVMNDIIDPEHLKLARKLKELVGVYEENRDLITEKLNNIIVVGYYNTDALFSSAEKNDKGKSSGRFGNNVIIRRTMQR